jgi:hypothetical protein
MLKYKKYFSLWNFIFHFFLMNLVTYTEKSFVVNGETKEHKEELKKLGGKWNSNLSCGAGWIFSLKSLADVEEFVKSKNNNNETTIEIIEEDGSKSNIKPKITSEKIWLNDLLEKFTKYLMDNTKSIPKEKLKNYFIGYMMERQGSDGEKILELFAKFICQTKPSLEEYIKLRHNRDAFIELALCNLCNE